MTTLPLSADGFEFTDVILQPVGGPPVVGLGLRLDQYGLTVTGPDPRVATPVGWSGISGPLLGEPGVLADGSPTLELTGLVGPRWVRWIIPAGGLSAERAVALRKALERYAGPSAAMAVVLGPPPSMGMAHPALAPTGSLGAEPSEDTGGFAAPGARGQGRGPAVVVVSLVVVLIAAAVTLAVVSSQKQTTTTVSKSPGDHEVAQQINISARDVPATWSVDNSSNGPLAAFFSNRSSEKLSAGQKRQVSALATQYEQCMGISAHDDRIFGGAGSSPTAVATSPVFSDPTAGPVVETGSESEVFASPTAVSADEAQVSGSQFPTCFGAALGQEFLLGAPAGGQVTFGTPEVQPLTLPQRSGVHAVGVDLTIPITSTTATVPTHFGFVLTGGGRAEATLITFAAGVGFPPAMTTSLTSALEHHIAMAGLATGT